MLLQVWICSKATVLAKHLPSSLSTVQMREKWALSARLRWCHRSDRRKLNVELIGEGEIIVKGHNVMKGYHNRPDANDEVFNEDGYFRTGDMGRFDENGYLFITGRIKEQYKIQNGKYVVPAPIEEKLTMTPYVDAAYVHGANMEYNICVLSLNPEAINEYLTSMGVSKKDEQTADHPIVSKLIENLISFLEGAGLRKTKEFHCTFDE